MTDNVKRLILVPLLSLLLPLSVHQQTAIKILPPAYGVYHGAFPYFGPLEDRVNAPTVNAFNALAGKPIAWATFSNNWFKGIVFPTVAVRCLSRKGVIPFMRLMPRANYHPDDSTYALQKIIDGEFDAALTRWALSAKRLGVPFMAEFGCEPNGDWFPWSGIRNGGGRTDGYGDPSVPDGPERFRDAFRHIINLCRSAGALNITWAFHVNAGSSPDSAWNTMAAYYPGDDYIDWIGESAYGAQVQGEWWSLLTDVLDESYPELAALSPAKPLALFEYGVIADSIPGHKAAWIREGLDALRAGRYPRIKAVSYWHSRFRNALGMISNMRIDSSPDVRLAYRAEVADSFFVARPVYSAPLADPIAQSVGTPGETTLEQNYPNPFNPTTTISYNLSRPSQVTLRVFSILGAEVARLVDEVQDDGFYGVEWSPASAAGTPVASGIYFYRLEVTPLDAPADLTVATRSMLYVK